MDPIGTTLAAAFTTGFLGSAHCAGMCGSVAAAVSARFSTTPMERTPSPLAETTKQFAWAAAGRTIPIVAAGPSMRASLGFNMGRLTSYALAGALAAAVAGLSAQWQPDGQPWQIDGSSPVRLALFLIGQLMVIATGLYVMGWTTPLRPLERFGQRIWQRVQPHAAALLRGRAAYGGAPFAFGVLWGWIPCGMVYGALALATATVDATHGAATMLAFGLGTLPAMLTAGSAGGVFLATLRNRRVRLATGTVIVVMGLAGLASTPARQHLAALLAFCRHALPGMAP